VKSDFSAATDEDLILLLQKGDTAAFKEIYNRYWDKLFNSAFKRLNNAQLSEEIVQDVFTKLWIKRERLAFVAGVSNYLFTAIKYNVIDYYRKQLQRTNYQNYLGLSHSGYTNNTEENIFVRDLKASVQYELNLLPPKCRSVYELSRHQYKTNREIALLLNISEKTVEGHLTRALAQLRLSLSDYMVFVISILFIK
jgi:RNA polymerase sigma-70 factor (family 1)